jgi:uncharacterized repeat protein (TIGR02543 family)
MKKHHIEVKRNKVLSVLLTLSLVIGLFGMMPLTAGAATGDVVNADSIKQGDIVCFGHYPQDDLGTVSAISVPAGTEGIDWVTSAAVEYDSSNLGIHYYAVKPIAWKVLENAGGKLFLLAQDGLDAKKYHEELESVTWEKSTVRSWLNGYGASENTVSPSGIDYTAPGTNFISTAFTAEEQGFIAETALENPDNTEHSTSGGNDTTDKVFFLKLQDTTNTAFGWPASIEASPTREIVPTDFAKAHSAYYDEGEDNYGNAIWWLRSPGDDYCAAVMGFDGQVSYNGTAVTNNNVSARPAFNLSNLESIIFTSAAANGAYNAYIKRTVTFDPQGGAVAPNTLTAGEGVAISAFGALPTPARTGYSFDAWYTSATDGTKITPDTIISGDVTYYAHWTQDSSSDVIDPPILTDTPVPVSEIAGLIGMPQPEQSVALPRAVDFGGGHQSDVTWTSGAAGDTGKATIGADGNLTGTAEGTVTLTGTSKTDPADVIIIKITIAKNVTAVRTPVKALYLAKGKTLTPPVAFDGKDAQGKAWGYGQTAKLIWKSGKTSVATVNAATGKITAKKAGTAKITATALNGRAKITFTVKVVKKTLKLKKVALMKPPKSLKKGNTAVLKVKLTSAKATGIKVTFKSSKPKVLKVDKAGKLYAAAKGKAKITVKAGGKRKVITVRVK